MTMFLALASAYGVPAISLLPAMQTAHAILQFLLLCTALFLTFDLNFRPLHHCYLVGLTLNTILFALTLVLDLVMTTCVAKRMILWLLYYEFNTPIVFVLFYLIQTQYDIFTIAIFFVFYVCLPLLFFLHLTLQSVGEFMQDI